MHFPMWRARFNSASDSLGAVAILRLRTQQHSPQRVSFDITRHKLLLRIPNERELHDSAGEHSVYSRLAPTFVAFVGESLPATLSTLPRTAEHLAVATRVPWRMTQMPHQRTIGCARETCCRTVALCVPCHLSRRSSLYIAMNAAREELSGAGPWARRVTECTIVPNRLWLKIPMRLTK